MKESNLLTISIPTFNGAKTLRQTLDSVVKQIEPGVDVLVSDNASTENIEELIQSYPSHIPISYWRNESNLGPDANFNLAVRRSEGKFVWLLSDDDALEDNAIGKVIAILKVEKNIKAVFCNWRPFSDDLSLPKGQNTIGLSADIRFDDHNEFISAVKLNPLLVSACVFEKEAWIKSMPERFVGSSWVHYGVLLAVVREGGAYCVADPLVKFRSGLLGWKKKYRARLQNSFSLNTILLDARKLGYRPRVIKELRNVCVSDLPVIVYGAKQHDWQFLDSLRTIGNFWTLSGFWYMTLPILLTPSLIIRLFGDRPLRSLMILRKWRATLMNKSRKE